MLEISTFVPTLTNVVRNVYVSVVRAFLKYMQREEAPDLPLRVWRSVWEGRSSNAVESVDMDMSSRRRASLRDGSFRPRRDR